MAKNSIRDYSATNSSNTDIQSIDISEGCSPAGINNAIREVMADLKDVSTGAVALESPAMDSASLTGNLTFGDSAKATFGTGSDFEIFHDGSNTYLTETGGVGNVYLRANNLVLLNNANEAYVDCVSDGAVTLYHDNAVKLATTATGVDVTGTGTMDRLGLGAAAHASAALLLTTTNQHIRLDNGGELGVIELESNGDLNIWAHGDGETINLKTGSGAGTDVLSVVGNNVGIGTSSPTHNLTVGSTASSDFVVALRGGVGGFFGWDDSANTTVLQAPNTRSLSFQVNSDTFSSGTEAMRISSGASVLVGTTGLPTSARFASAGTTGTFAGVFVNGVGSQAYGVAISSGTGEAVYFYHGGTIGSPVGSISTSASSTSYNTSSDYRLKTAVTYDWDATTRLKQLRPARFEWIADGDDAVPVDGFLAHEVQDIVPEAISGTKDAMRDEEYEVSAATGDIYTPAIDAVLDEDGNEVTPAVAEVIHSTDVERPEELAEGQKWRETTEAVMGTRSVPDYQGIDQSKLVPLLVKTIQELEARITALEAN